MDYNIGAGGETDGITVADTVLRLLDKPDALKQFVRDRPGHDRRYAVDSARLRGMGWQPQVAFEEGMQRTVTWFATHEDWWRPLKSGEFWEFYQRNYKPATTGVTP
jgi:dTDP-glucose 4,6-dehydratase